RWLCRRRHWCSWQEGWEPRRAKAGRHSRPAKGSNKENGWKSPPPDGKSRRGSKKAPHPSRPFRATDSLRRATPLPAPVLPGEGAALQVHADIAPFRAEAIRLHWYRLSFVPTGSSRRTLWGARSLHQDLLHSELNVILQNRLTPSHRVKGSAILLAPLRTLFCAEG